MWDDERYGDKDLDTKKSQAIKRIQAETVLT